MTELFNLSKNLGASSKNVRYATEKRLDGLDSEEEVGTRARERDKERGRPQTSNAREKLRGPLNNWRCATKELGTND